MSLKKVAVNNHCVAASQRFRHAVLVFDAISVVDINHFNLHALFLSVGAICSAAAARQRLILLNDFALKDGISSGRESRPCKSDYKDKYPNSDVVACFHGSANILRPSAVAREQLLVALALKWHMLLRFLHPHLTLWP